MSLARNTAVIGGLTLVSRIFGFARDLVITAALGAGPVADAFNAALRFPNLFRRLFAEGAFSQAFVPVYSKALAESGAEAADQIARQSLSVLLLATAVLSALAMAFMPWINAALLFGYADDPQTLALANLLTRITMPYLVCMTAATLFAGVLNARSRFVLAAGAPILLNLSLLVAMWPTVALILSAWHPLRGLSAYAETFEPEHAALVCSIAVLVSGVLQAAVVWFGAARSGADVKLTFPRVTPNVKRLVKLAIPAAIAGGALQINLIVSQAFASVEEGAITYLANADRLYQIPLGLIGIAVGVSMLPRLSRLVQAEDHAGARGALDEAVNLSMAFTLPAAAAMLAIPYFLYDGLFTRGQFTSEDARSVADALFHYGWGVPAFVLARIFAPAFFAREDTKAPMRYALISMALNIVFGAALFFGLRAYGMPGFPGLAIATSAASWLNVALMLRALVARGAYGPTPAALFRFSRILLASAALFALLAWAGVNRDMLQDVLVSKERAVALLVLGGGVFYFALAFALRAVTWSEVRRAFRREPKSPDTPANGGAGLPPGLDG